MTGSNAELLSGEIATHFAGRAQVLTVYPLSYDEFLVFPGREDGDDALRDYLHDGGLPFLGHLPLREGGAFEKAVVGMGPLLAGERGVAHLHLRDLLRDGWSG